MYLYLPTSQHPSPPSLHLRHSFFFVGAQGTGSLGSWVLGLGVSV